MATADASNISPILTGIAGLAVASSIALVKGAIASRSKENEVKERYEKQENT